MQDFDFIETPENVELQRRLAGIGSRFIAGLLDVLIIAGILLVLVLVFYLVGLASIFTGSQAAWWAAAILLVLAFLVMWGYFAFFEMRTNGQSPGKKLAKVRVVKDSGSPITFVDVAIRNLLRLVDFLPLFYGVGGLVMFITARCQRLGDLAAGTVVVSETVSDYSASSDRRIQAQWNRQATAETLRATGLKPEEYRLLYNYYMRRNQLSLEARLALLPRLLGPILQRTARAMPAMTLEAMEAVVDEVVARAYYAETRAAGPAAPEPNLPAGRSPTAGEGLPGGPPP